MIKDVDKLSDFGPLLESSSIVIRTGWCQNPECEKLLKNYSASIRCLLRDNYS